MTSTLWGEVSDFEPRNRKPLRVSISERRCCRCKQTLPIQMFPKRANGQYGQICAECKQFHQPYKPNADPDASYDRHLRWKYGITLAEYMAMLDAQAGVCAICGSALRGNSWHKRLCVDHDHATGKVRGLLCSACNTAIGRMDHNVDYLRAAIDYLERTGA